MEVECHSAGASCMNAIDTNVLVYAFDEQQIAKQERAIALLDRLTDQPSETILLWQVACEFLAVLRRWQFEGRILATDVEAYCHEVLGYFPLACPIPAVIPLALQLSSRHSLSHWDSILLAAAIKADVDTLYTEDLQDGVKYESVSVVNPFA
jgi:predicted nucleic acid-binding protein